MPSGVFVVGCGSIGERHLRNLRALGAATLMVFDQDAARAHRVAGEHGATAVPTLDAGLASGPRAVLVCTPPSFHIPVAMEAVASGAHVFVEKPISHTLDGVEGLLAEALRRRRVVAVGYNLRFHRGLQHLKDLVDSGAVGRVLVLRAEVGQYLPTWRPGTDYRTGYIARPETGGGILLDASHELDYVRWLGGEVARVYCAAGHLSGLEISTEDVAALILRLENEALAEIHLDCVQRGYSRTCKIIGEQGTLSWDFRAGITLTTDADVRAIPGTGTTDVNAMYVDEMRQFLLAADGVEPPRVDGATARRVLELALAARRSAEIGQEVAV